MIASKAKRRKEKIKVLPRYDFDTMPNTVIRKFIYQHDLAPSFVKANQKTVRSASRSELVDFLEENWGQKVSSN